MTEETMPDPSPQRRRLKALPDPEVAARPQRRVFTADYKVKILREIDACTEPGQVGAILRREALYSSHVSNWRREREKGALAHPTKRGRRANPSAKRIAELEKLNRRLERKLAHAEALIDLQKKVSALLGVTLASQEEGSN
jgi:transposase-like protein